jgi:hypothetical protein
MVFLSSIYADKDELSIATETYLKNNHGEFFQKFNVSNWNVYFTNNIQTTVSLFFDAYIHLRITINIFLVNTKSPF